MEKVGLSMGGVKTAREETGTACPKPRQGLSPAGASRTSSPSAAQVSQKPSPSNAGPRAEAAAPAPTAPAGTLTEPHGPLHLFSFSISPLQSSSAPLQRKAKHILHPWALLSISINLGSILPPYTLWHSHATDRKKITTNSAS